MKKAILTMTVVALLLGQACNSKKEVKTDKEKGTQVTVDDNNTDFDLYQQENDSLAEDSVNNTVKVIDVKDTVAQNTVKNEVKTTDKEPVLQENQDGTLKKVSEKEISKTTKEHVKKFYVIAGSYKEMPNAIAMRKFFKDKGYSSMILFPYNGYNRVATGSYTTREQAQKDIKKLRNLNMLYQGEKITYWLLWR